MTRSIRLRTAALGAATWLLAASGCVRLNQPAPQIRDYTLSYPAPAPESESLGAVLQIPPFAVSAAYDSHGMMYREGELQLTRYVYDRWAANPGNLVADTLARDFAETGVFRAVQHARAPLASDYRLSGEIEAIEEVVGADACVASLEIRILLVALRRIDRDAVVLRRGYREQIPCRCDEAASLAASMSAALQHISESLRSDVVTTIAADLAAPTSD